MKKGFSSVKFDNVIYKHNEKKEHKFRVCSQRPNVKAVWADFLPVRPASFIYKTQKPPTPSLALP
jgi:hypothetical protein